MHAPSPVKETHHYLRIAIFILVAIIVIPILIFMYSIAAEFMVNAEDLKPRSVTVTRITRSSVLITWMTDHTTQGVVEYGTSPQSLISYAPEAEPVRDHRVELTLLNSSTTYYFHLKIGDTTYDNEGMPWSFVTKSPTGEDVSEQVRGISTRIRSATKPSPTRALTPAVCDVTVCTDIQRKLGKGCTVADYVKCIAMTPSRAPTYSSASTRVNTPTQSKTNITPAMQTGKCRPSYLYADASSTNKCTRWVWEREDSTGKAAACRDEFDHYELECKSNSFVPTPGTTLAPEQQYFNGSISDITRNTASLDVTPDKGLYVFCQVRAVDVDGYSSNWYQGSAKCE